MSETKGSLLLAWQVKDKHCLVIGSGDVALSRIQHLITAQAKITVITGTSKLHPKILQLNEQGKIFNLVQRDYQSNDLTLYENINSRVNDLDLVTEDNYKFIDQQVFQEVLLLYAVVLMIMSCLPRYIINVNT